MLIRRAFSSRALAALALYAVILAIPGTTRAQDDSVGPYPWLLYAPYEPHRPLPLLTRRDGFTALGFVLGTIALSTQDANLARVSQSPDLQNSEPVRRTSDVFRVMGDPGAVYLSMGLFAAGHVAAKPGITRLGLRATEAIITAGAMTELLKLGFGRARPNVIAPGEEGPDQDVFRFGRGQRGYASLPSGHTTAAFAAASAITAELHDTHPDVARVAGPVLYGSAVLVGLSRLYTNDHWGSDVLLGAAIGTFFGRKVVRFHHSRPGGWLDTIMIPTMA
ncbi:MAG: phosphatase PAP2 family protein, partial [Gemmatimonadaceae bacterium]